MGDPDAVCLAISLVFRFHVVPIIDALDERMRFDLYQRLHQSGNDNYFVNASKSAQHQSAGGIREYRPAGFIDVRVVSDGHYKPVSHRPRCFQMQQMSNVQQIENAIGQHDLHSTYPLALASL